MARDWEAAFRSTDPNGVLYVNTLAVHVEPPLVSLGDPSANEVAQAVFDWLATEYRACLNTTLTVTEIGTRELFSSTPAAGSKVVGALGTLPNGTGLLPAEICGVITWRTAIATRSGRGRVFIPGPAYSSELVGRDTWKTSTGFLTAMQAFANKVMAGANFTHSAEVWHISGRVHSRTDSVSRDITSAVVRSRPHWLRSRSTAP